MLKVESNFDFQKRYCRIHKQIHGWKNKTPEEDELVLGGEVTVCLKSNSEVALVAAKDFAAYLKTAFGIKVRFVSEGGDLRIGLDTSLKDYMERKVTVDDSGITVAAADDRGIAQALYGLEDQMNDRKAPFLKKAVSRKKTLFTPRMIHSGYSMDIFPDEYLSVCAHHGFDAILVYVIDPDHSRIDPVDPYDFSDLIRRAARYGIDVYAYCCITNFLHPEAEGAKEVYAKVYGDVFKKHPFKGMVFVGESVEFPSKDPRTSMAKHRTLPPDGIPTGKASPSRYPCCDYAEWISLVRDSIRAVKPDADVVFWTYNWGWAPEDVRLELLDRLPTDISLLVTFEMFEKFPMDNSWGNVSDYSIYLPGPGAYFASEAKKAKERGIRLYTQCNTAGRPWDFGVVPYDPFPGRWHLRNEALLKAREDWGLCGLMESHHMGFTPSFVTKLSKETFSEGSEPYEVRLERIAKNYSETEYQTVLEGLAELDASVDGIAASVENQYGPYRVGPAYPFCITLELKKPDKPGTVHGNRIYKVLNQNRDTFRSDPYSVRIRDEMRMARLAMKRTKNAVRKFRSVRNKSVELQRLINMVEFMICCHQTTIHFQKFYLLRQKLLSAPTLEGVYKAEADIEKLVEAERKNVRAAIPLVRKDSALGFEPSMNYVCDEEALLWKLKQLDFMVDKELDPYKPKDRQKNILY